MPEPPSAPTSTVSPTPEVSKSSPSTPTAALEQTLSLLSSRDDTSRFVGLALLKSLLDVQEGLRNNPDIAARCWDAVPATFLDRLLRATDRPTGEGSGKEGGKKQRKSVEEANNMVDLAVGVIHSFTLLLSGSVGSNSKLGGRTPALVAVLARCPSPETRIKILQTLLSFQTGGVEGTRSFLQLEVDQLSPLLDLCIAGSSLSSADNGKEQSSMALAVINYAFHNATVSEGSDLQAVSLLQEWVDQILVALVSRFEKHAEDQKPANDTAAVLRLFAFIAETIPRLPFEVTSESKDFLLPSWVEACARLIRRQIIYHPFIVQGHPKADDEETDENEGSIAILCSVLLESYPLQFPLLLFGGFGAGLQDGRTEKSKQKRKKDEKPFAYLFPTMVSIDLRSSFPALHETLTSPSKQDGYERLSRRLAADFNILSAFLGFLISDLSSSTPGALELDPNLLLQLRRQFAETSSLTIEFLRDWWDANTGAVLGAALDQRSRTRLLTFESNETAYNTDVPRVADTAKGPLIIAAVRYLSLWLREDENEGLRREAAGILDVLLRLYNLCDDDRKHGGTTTNLRMDRDFKSPVLVALEGILNSEDGIESFQREKGWTILSTDLSQILHGLGKSTAFMSDARRGIEIVRVLFQLVESETSAGATTGEERLVIVRDIAELPPPSAPAAPGISQEDDEGSSFTQLLELSISSYQLAAALLEHAAPALRRRYAAETAKIRQAAASVIDMSRQERTKDLLTMTEAAEEQVTGAKEVVQWLDELKI